jgi:hypothetical protein
MASTNLVDELSRGTEGEVEKVSSAVVTEGIDLFEESLAIGSFLDEEGGDKMFDFVALMEEFGNVSLVRVVGEHDGVACDGGAIPNGVTIGVENIMFEKNVE